MCLVSISGTVPMDKMGQRLAASPNSKPGSDVNWYLRVTYNIWPIGPNDLI